MQPKYALGSIVLGWASLSGAATIAAAHMPGAHVHGEAQAAMVVNGPDFSISLTSAMYHTQR